MLEDFKKYLCCINLTLATKIIASIGLIISIILTTTLINDGAGYGDKFDASRKTALAFGLDLQHFHVHANASAAADPEGDLIILIMSTYAVLFLVTNLLLIYATITCNKYFTIPWLVCEMCGCLSKVAALIYHIIEEPNEHSKLFIAGSTIYILLMGWWWLVVLVTQSTWKYQKKIMFNVSLVPRPSVSFSSEIATANQYQLDSPCRSASQLATNISMTESPAVYNPHQCYPTI